MNGDPIDKSIDLIRGFRRAIAEDPEESPGERVPPLDWIRSGDPDAGLMRNRNTREEIAALINEKHRTYRLID